jgi:hypothetical protein
MAEGDAILYDNFITHLVKGHFNLETDTVKVALLSGYTPDADTDAAWADVSAKDYASGGNYVAGGQQLTDASLTWDANTGSMLWNASDVTWANLGPLDPAVPSHLVAYSCESEFVGSPLIAYWTLGDTATNGGPYTVQWHSLGLVMIGPVAS